MGRDPSGGGGVGSRNGWNLIRRRHGCFKVVGFLGELGADNAAGELGGVDVHVVIFGILDQAPQRLQRRRIRGINRHFPIDRADTIGVRDTGGAAADSGIDDD